jgi:3',5'-cyclic AMP phosphodiesterase CpdA
MTDTVTLAHLSDLHLGPIAGFHPRYWNLKRGLGYLNWQRQRRTLHMRELADAIAADVVAQKPDHIAVTGDLANIGLPGEYEAALAWLTALGDPKYVSVVPGNHDIYTARMHSGSCLVTWEPYMRGDTGTAPSGSAVFPPARSAVFPYVRRIGPLAIIGLNSAIPTPSFVASGRLGREQLEAFAFVLQRLGEEDAIRVVLIHHPPLPGQAPPRRGLEDAPDFSRVIEDKGAELILHGHNHLDMLAWCAHERGHTAVVGVASGSAARLHRNEPLARYNLLRIGRRDGRVSITCTTRGFSASGGDIVDLAHRELSPVI